MIQIGDKEVVFGQTFLVPEGQDVTLAIPVRDNTLRIALKLVPLAEGQSQGAEWVTSDGVLAITLRGWNNPVGTTLKASQRIGDVKGEPLWFNAAVYGIGTIGVVHFQILLGGANA